MKLTFTAARWNLEGNKRNDNSEQEEKMYQMAIQIEPKVVVSYLNSGVLYLNRKDYSRALTRLKEALALDPANAQAYFNLGLLNYRQKQFRQAAKHFKTVLQHQPRHADAYYNLGCIYFNNTKDTDQAIANFEQVRLLQPDHPLVYTSLGLCYEQKGEYQQAIQAFKQAVRLAPREKWTETARKHMATLIKLYTAEEKNRQEGL